MAKFSKVPVMIRVAMSGFLFSVPAHVQAQEVCWDCEDDLENNNHWLNWGGNGWESEPCGIHLTPDSGWCLFNHNAGCFDKEEEEPDTEELLALVAATLFSEILRQSEWFPETGGLYHFRDKDQNEVDVVAEDLEGRLVGIEVKPSATVRREDFRGLKKLALAGGEDFRLGVILYDGDRVFSFGEGLFAAPISTLWN